MVQTPATKFKSK